MRIAYNLDSRLRGNDKKDHACATRWNKALIWVHEDFAIGNMLMDGSKVPAVIDFGGAAVGDPACDLVIAWTYLSGNRGCPFSENPK